jgi:hypothetical protein
VKKEESDHTGCTKQKTAKDWALQKLNPRRSDDSVTSSDHDAPA